MATTLSIDVWSDVVCPFCYLGSRQLELALADFAHADAVVVNHHAFELDAHARSDYDVSLAELVARKYGISVERSHELHANLTAQAKSLGVAMSFDLAKPTNTFDAHRLIALSATQGKSDVMSERLFRAYFGEGLLVSDHDQLNTLAEEVGVLDAATAATASPSSRFMTRTPVASRPWEAISRTGGADDHAGGGDEQDLVLQPGHEGGHHPPRLAVSRMPARPGRRGPGG
jgi:predicted DsbA family dithiol-disulfide isomerase